MVETKMSSETPVENQKLHKNIDLQSIHTKQEKDISENDLMLRAFPPNTNGNRNVEPIPGTSSGIPPGKPSNFMDSIYRLLGFSKKSPKNGHIECTTREILTLITLLALIIVFLVSFTGFIVMWFTQTYNNSLVSNLVLAKNSTATKYWIQPPLNTYLKAHVFNYTNTERFLAGLDEYLKVEDLGPYTYTENTTKVNVIQNDNNTITYKEHRSYQFIPELSSGKQYDKVTVPNVPFISMLNSYARGEINFLTFQLALMVKPKVFISVPAHSLLWGYQDNLVDLSKTFSTLPFENFGMLVTRNGTSSDVFQINTGEDDLRKLGLISRFNGEKLMNFWSTDECNRVDGSDGSQFPPHLIYNREKIEVFIKAMCRKLPLVFDSEVNLFHGVPAWRYKTPLNVFAHPDVNPENQCYCTMEAGHCPFTGIFNGTLCYDAPIFISFPHFFSADSKSYSHYLKGIAPDAQKHQTFADIHPRLGFPIDGASRIQINVEYPQKQMNQPGLRNIPPGIILPVVWLEITSGNLTESVRALIYHSIYSANAIQIALRYGSLLTWVASLALIFATFYYRSKNQDSKTTV